MNPLDKGVKNWFRVNRNGMSPILRGIRKSKHSAEFGAAVRESLTESDLLRTVIASIDNACEGSPPRVLFNPWTQARCSQKHPGRIPPIPGKPFFSALHEGKLMGAEASPERLHQRLRPLGDRSVYLSEEMWSMWIWFFEKWICSKKGLWHYCGAKLA